MSATDSVASGLPWLTDFARANSRPLRVLHIGNIANNAYNNAKIQRQHGIEADVSCHDYFDVMACPEWEDAQFRGEIKDRRYPDWWEVDLRGFERPDWFAQGNWQTCQRYLRARRRRQTGRAAILWRQLEAERWLWCRRTAVARALGYRSGLALLVRYLRSLTATAARKTRDLARAVATLARGAGLREALLTVFPTRLGFLAHERAIDVTPVGKLFSSRFPGRRPLGRDDLRGYRLQARGWREVLQEYDVIQGYSIDSIAPFLCGAPAWTAYEHGTLREIPFEETPTGRICALVYTEAPVVFVTNSDVLPSVERLGIDPSRVVLLPHALDSERLSAFADSNNALAPAGSSGVTLYAPTRHDWADGDPSLSKGNDRLLRAAASLRPAFDFRLVLADWGRDVERSRRLVAELGLTDVVEWAPAARKSELWSRILSSHAVIDQFAIPAIGGLTAEAMALGRRVVTALDRDDAERFFGEAPPLLRAQSEDEIADALTRILEDPDDSAGLGDRARTWFERYHSAERIVDLQAAAYRRLLEESAA